MKKLLTLILALALILPAAALAGGLADAQKYIFNTAPANVMEREFTITGTLMELSYTRNSHLMMILMVDDEKAWDGVTTSFDAPGCIAAFPYHHEFENFPINIGDEVTITGSINSMYSTVMVPYFTIRTLNETDIETWMYENAWGEE